MTAKVLEKRWLIGTRLREIEDKVLGHFQAEEGSHLSRTNEACLMTKAGTDEVTIGETRKHSNGGNEGIRD